MQWMQVACVLMFQLQRDDFPVDTHVSFHFKGHSVCSKYLANIFLKKKYLANMQHLLQIFQIAKTLHWVPAAADVKKTYIHLNRRIPDELKFDLNCLIYTHGKVCRECSGKGSNKPKKEQFDKLCPLLGQSSDAIWNHIRNSVSFHVHEVFSFFLFSFIDPWTLRIYLCTWSFCIFFVLFHDPFTFGAAFGSCTQRWNKNVVDWEQINYFMSLDHFLEKTGYVLSIFTSHL